MAVATGLTLLSCMPAISSSPVSPGSKAKTVDGSKLRAQAIARPESGVALLENILGRFINAPQIAMANTNTMNQATSAKKNATPNSVDYSLAIRPKDSGKAWVTPSPSLQIVNSPVSGAGGGGGQTNSLRLAQAPNQTGMADANPQEEGEASNSAQEPRDDLGPETWKGGLLARGQAASAGLKKAQNNRSGFWEKDEENSNNALAGTANSLGSPPERQRVPDLATSIGHLAGIAKKMDEVQQLAQGIDKNAVEQKRKTVLASNSAKEKVSFYNTQTRDMAVPEVKDFRQLPETSMGKRIPVSGATLGKLAQQLNESSDRIADKQTSTKVRGSLLQSKPSALDASEERAKSEAARYDRHEVIALLPPNVANGIPLVSLGASQSQILTSLGGLGKTAEKKVGDWTVLSWCRGADKTDPCLQLFFRHGLLDAIRIFDRSLIAPDFGVSLGDELGEVKHKFGEPAFLVQEPLPGSGQNYIYPISRVGFQLARKDSSSAPQVVSVLIFSVK